jgi:hypothetical protein
LRHHTNITSVVITKKADEDISEDIIVPTIIIDTSSDTNTVDTVAQYLEVATPVSIVQAAPIPKIVDIKAERHKLEVRLYDSMESPMVRLARINRTASATAEYHYNVDDIEDYDVFFDQSSVDPDKSKRATDGNGFECVTVHDANSADTLNDDFEGVIAESTHASIDEVTGAHFNEPPTAGKATQLFSKIADTSASIVDTSNTKVSQTLDEVEESQKAKSEVADPASAWQTSLPSSLSADQLFAAVKAEGTNMVRLSDATADSPISATSQLFAALEAESAIVVRLPVTAGNSLVRAARTLACVEAGLTFVCEEEISLDSSFIDTAIVACEVQKSSAEVRPRPPVAPEVLKRIVLHCPDETAEAQPFIDPAIISLKTMEQQDVQEMSLPIVDTQVHDKPLQHVMDWGSEKIMTLLGVSGRAPTPVLAHQEGVDKIIALMGAARSRTTSSSSVPTPPDFSPVMNSGRSTPNTHLSVTPPLDECLAQSKGYNFAANGCVPGWAPHMGGFYPVVCGYQHPDFDPAQSFASEYQYQSAPAFPDFVPGQAYHASSWQPMAPAGYMPY